MDLGKVTSIWQILPLTVGTRARHMLLRQGRETLASGGHMQMYVAFKLAEHFFFYFFFKGRDSKKIKMKTQKAKTSDFPYAFKENHTFLQIMCL